MEEKYVLGERIRNFRKRAGLSQLQLEVAIGMSPGGLSRIETGDVRPSRDTIEKVTEYLKLNLKEKAFLNGYFSDEISAEELSEAYNEVSYAMESPLHFSYLIDEKYRVWELSEGFARVFKLSKDDVNQLRGKHLLEFIFQDNLPIHKFLQSPKVQKMQSLQIARFIKEVPFWDIDPYCRSLIDSLMKNQNFKKTWEALSSASMLEAVYSNESRQIALNLNGKIFDLNYSREYLKRNPRFMLISYFPSNPFLRFVKNIIQAFN